MNLMTVALVSLIFYHIHLIEEAEFSKATIVFMENPRLRAPLCI